jgi:uncharacterized protein (TIGR00369 family)
MSRTDPSRSEHHRKLERLYLQAPVNSWYRPRIHIEEGWAEIVVPVREEHFHAAHAVHGSVYFKVLDDAAFFAANSVLEDVFVLTASFQLDLLRPVSSGEIRAEGRLIHRTRRLFIAESKAEDSEGNLIARGSGTFMRSSIRLDERVGYVEPDPP